MKRSDDELRKIKGRKSVGAVDWRDLFDVSRRINSKRPKEVEARRQEAPWAEDDIDPQQHFKTEAQSALEAGVAAQDAFNKCLARQLEHGGDKKPLAPLLSLLPRKGGLPLKRRASVQEEVVTPQPQQQLPAASSLSDSRADGSYRCPSTNDLGVYDIEKCAARKNMFHPVGKKVFPEGFKPLPGEDPTAVSAHRKRGLRPLEAYKERREMTLGDRGTLPNEWDIRIEMEAALRQAAKRQQNRPPPPLSLTPVEMTKAALRREAPPPRSISVLTERRIDERVDELIREHREGLRRHQQIMKAVAEIPIRTAK